MRFLSRGKRIGEKRELEEEGMRSLEDEEETVGGSGRMIEY